LNTAFYVSYISGLFLSVQDVVAAVVIMTYNRPDYLDRALKSVLKYVICLLALLDIFMQSKNCSTIFEYHSSLGLTLACRYHKAVADRFPLFVSQDGADWTVMSKARSFSQVNYMQHFDEGPPRTAKPGEIIAYYKIASEISSTSS
jgi:alpha-1,3-mannosyl-glycoprotein beta-1,2-N-acetylglucosaminyltransferase